jgi:hypothetical protein
MKDGGIGGFEVPPQLKLDPVKPSELAKAASASSRPIPAPTDPSSGSSTTAKWNTKNLALRLGADLISAASAAVLVAPIISIIDR